MSDGEVNLALLQYKSEVGSGVPRAGRHPPLRLPVRRPSRAAEADREGRRQVLLRSRRPRGRRLRAQVQGSERHRLRHQLEGLAAHQGQGEERQGRPRACDETRGGGPEKSQQKDRQAGQDGAEEEVTREDVTSVPRSGEGEGNDSARAFACAFRCARRARRFAGAQAQNYPARTVTVIVPFAAGGPADITGRIVADIFSRHLGQQFVVENVGGAGGTTGSLRGARAAPDGYTLDLRPHGHPRRRAARSIPISATTRRRVSSRSG